MSARALSDEQEGLAGDFWRYSANLYGQPGISEKCLRLQDDAGVDVNVMLFCCWAAFHVGTALGTEDILGLLDATDDWREGAVKPIRRLRRELKKLTGRTDGAGFVYDAIKRCELDAEKMKQRLLIKAAETLGTKGPGMGDRMKTAHANIESYFAVQGVEKGAWVETSVANIVTAAAELSINQTSN